MSSGGPCSGSRASRSQSVFIISPFLPLARIRKPSREREGQGAAFVRRVCRSQRPCRSLSGWRCHRSTSGGGGVAGPVPYSALLTVDLVIQLLSLVYH